MSAVKSKYHLHEKLQYMNIFYCEYTKSITLDQAYKITTTIAVVNSQ